MYSNYTNKRLLHNMGYQVKPLRLSAQYQRSFNYSAKTYVNKMGDPIVNRTKYDGVQMHGGSNKSIDSSPSQNIYNVALQRLSQAKQQRITPIKPITSQTASGMRRRRRKRPVRTKRNRRKRKKRIMAKPKISKKIISNLQRQMIKKKIINKMNEKKNNQLLGTGISIHENINRQVKSEKEKRKEMLATSVRISKKPPDPIKRLKNKLRKSKMKKSIFTNIRTRMKK